MEIKLTNVGFLFRKRLLMILMRTFIFLLCTTLFSMTPENTFSQTKVVIDADKEVSIDEVFKIIKAQTDYTFVYQMDIFKNVPKVQLKKGTIRLDKLLNQSIQTKDFNVILSSDNTILIKKKVRFQQKQVSGKVTDEAGLSVPGAGVLIKGTTRGTATDINGDYSISVSDPANVLVFSSLGFETQEITVGNQTTINISLKESISQLDEVTINAGYYKTSKREATGSIAKVDAKTIEKQPVSNLVATLQGRMPGVQITQSSGVAGGGFKIQIRGQNSLRVDGNNPLILIDGMPFSIESASNGTVSGGLYSPFSGTSPLNSINPADIESVEVLKDADATAIYGSRGANGVVLITTKKGKAGKTKFDVNMYSGFSTVTNTMDLMNTEQYLEMRNEAYALDNRNPFGRRAIDLLLWDQNRYTDWQEELIGGTAYTNNIQASVSGGNESTQFFFGGGYYKETTVFPGDFDYGRISAHLKVNHQSHNKKFKFNASVNYVSDENNNIGVDFTRTALTLAPNAPALLNDEGELNWENFNANPLATLERIYLGKTKNLVSNVNLQYEFLKDVTFKTNLGYNTVDFDESLLFPSTTINPAFGAGSEFSIAHLNNTSRASWIIEPQLNWKMKLGKGILDVLVGTTFQESTNSKLVTSGRGFPDNSLITNIAAASDITLSDSGNTEYRYNAAFGRINYNYDGKYIINITGRRDGSTRFGPNKQFANFGAVGAAWLFSKENLFKDSSFLSFGKLRASYGSTGSDQIGDYQYLDSYTLSSDNYGGTTTLLPTQLFNPNFAWEINKKLEFTLDLGLFKDRIFLSTSYYRNRSSNQLIGLPLSRLTGFTSIQSNFPATVENRGLELELNTTNINKGAFTWKSSLNITIPSNELIAFPDLEKSDAFNDKLVIGEPISILKLYEYTGVDSDTGVFTFTDFNNDGVINVDDRQVVKSLEPEYFGGFSNSIAYKGFEFDFLFQFVKQKGLNYFKQGFLPGVLSNLPSALFDNRWHEIGDVTTYQRYTTGRNRDASSANNRYVDSNMAVSDASFVRLKNVSLSYTLSENWTKGFKVRLYAQGQNLLTFTDYFGLDPETQGINLPSLKTLTLGAQFTF